MQKVQPGYDVCNGAHAGAVQGPAGTVASIISDAGRCRGCRHTSGKVQMSLVKAKVTCSAFGPFVKVNPNFIKNL